MGGGNLNLKKSWHPSTLKNQERVWKVQQQDEMEKKRTQELQQELRHEREREHYQVRAPIRFNEYLLRGVTKTHSAWERLCAILELKHGPLSLAGPER